MQSSSKQKQVSEILIFFSVLSYRDDVRQTHTGDANWEIFSGLINSWPNFSTWSFSVRLLARVQREGSSEGFFFLHIFWCGLEQCCGLSFVRTNRTRNQAINELTVISATQRNKKLKNIVVPWIGHQYFSPFRCSVLSCSLFSTEITPSAKRNLANLSIIKRRCAKWREGENAWCPESGARKYWI